jgi:hypothetical protein
VSASCRTRSFASLNWTANATIGSILDAFQAGICPAITATATRSAPTSISVTGRVASLVERAGESVVLLAEAPSAVRIQSLNKTRNRRRETALFDQILKRHESDSAGVHHWRRRCYSVVGHRRDPRAGH